MRLPIVIQTLLCLLLFGVGSGRGQSPSAPLRMTFKIGAGYDQGDYGGTELSKSIYVPVSLRYTGKRFDLGVSTAAQGFSSGGGFRLIDGTPTPTGTADNFLRNSGMGDTVIRSRIYAYSPEEGAMPAVTPFVKVKIPTAPADKGLGTGKTDFAVGVELDSALGPVSLFGDASYTAVGKVAGLNLRNRPAASIGIAGRVARPITLSGALDWRRSLVAGNPNPTEFSGAVSCRVSPTVTLTPNAFVGLSEGSADFGLGMQMAVRF